ncbi:MAG: 16S rRNA (cytidine(1402)-2'-O)-methyltransferase [Spirochaetes bacterium]|nr:16S rRNA (cytidine(1402)-2'-O)-methyltransferase [Spirochaetota bacterium]
MAAGTLYIIATPIGNLEDITFRAVRVLKEETDTVFCEDTRQTRKLFNHYGIRAPLQSLHTHSSQRKIESVIGLLLSGKSVAYLTDSGTPGLSDPGSRLVSAARDSGVPVSPVPGPSALAAIVSVSGLHGKTVVFSGFLSKKENRRRTELQSLKKLEGLIVLYESPYRIKKLLAAINEIYPGRRVLIGREMTKLHEEFISAPIQELVASIDTIKEKGEFTVAICNYKEDYVENDREN